MTSRFSCYSLIFSLLVITASVAYADSVKLNKALLVSFVLKAQDLMANNSRIRGFSEGGQFEIKLKPQAIAEVISNCNNGIIVRMPYTDERLSGAAEEINEKKEFYNELMQLQAGQKDAVTVVVDVAPYGKVISEEPLKVQLSKPACNAFFYSSGGHVLRQLPAQ